MKLKFFFSPHQRTFQATIIQKGFRYHINDLCRNFYYKFYVSREMEREKFSSTLMSQFLYRFSRVFNIYSDFEKNVLLCCEVECKFLLIPENLTTTNDSCSVIYPSSFQEKLSSMPLFPSQPISMFTDQHIFATQFLVLQ